VFVNAVAVPENFFRTTNFVAASGKPTGKMSDVTSKTKILLFGAKLVAGKISKDRTHSRFLLDILQKALKLKKMC
jgi:hypothetical protein